MDKSGSKQISDSLVGFEAYLIIFYISESYVINFWGIQKIIIPYKEKTLWVSVKIQKYKISVSISCIISLISSDLR